nr:MAG: putative RNA-dependent RNA polymerase [Narnaviridae sp.]
MRSCWDVLSDADPVFRYCSESDFHGLFDVVLQAPTPADSVSWQKFLTAWPMAALLRQEEPPMPKGLRTVLGEGNKFLFPLRGGARRHLRNLLASRSSNLKSCRVAWAILQGVKRGCAEVPGDFICQTMRKHQSALTQNLPSLSEDDAERFRKKFREIWRSKHEFVTRIGTKATTWVSYGTCRKMRHFADLPANPGFNASYETTRGQGGRAGAVRRALLEELSYYDEIPEGLTETQWPLLSMTERRPGEVVENHYLPVATNRLARKLALESLRRTGGKCLAKVAGILEPLKCRLITKGSALPYWAAQPFQRALWERLQDYKPFRLTGRPMDAGDLYEIEEQGKRVGLNHFDQWVSGDYSAATDGLSQQINSLCLEEAIRGAALDEEEATVARAVLGNHRIVYVNGEGSDFRFDAEHETSFPDALKKEEHEIDQTNGQLMGSVLSFPVLCAINVAAYWIALEEHTGRKFELNDLPVMVNGDDIAFKADTEFYEVWKRWTSCAGFTLSLGKNYISPDFVTINSEGYVASRKKDRLTLTKVGFLNTGLLYCGKSETEVDWREESKPKVGLRAENREMPFTAKVNRVIEESCDPARTLLRVHELYRADIAFHTHRGEINMHAAPELGGLGITLPQGCTTRFTPWQQRVAGYLRHKWKTMDFGSVVGERDGAKVLDLNKPMGLDGRMTYQLKKKPIASAIVDVRPGRVVVRKKLEPLRENEERLTDNSVSLMNYQADFDRSQGEWKIRQLSKADVEGARNYKGSVVRNPLVHDEEIRVLVPDEELESDKYTKLVAILDSVNLTGTPEVTLKRTDSQFTHIFRSPTGNVIVFPSPVSR